MPTLQELERPIDEAIVNELIEATPQWWKVAILEIEWHPQENGVEGFQHRILSPEGHNELVQASGQIHESSFRLADLFRKHGKQWLKVVYSVRQESSGEWKYSADFTY
ncbi:MAG: hypothetical protein WCH99_06355 [Verrucomicrobiota bacterium]